MLFSGHLGGCHGWPIVFVVGSVDWGHFSGPGNKRNFYRPGEPNATPGNYRFVFSHVRISGKRVPGHGGGSGLVEAPKCNTVPTSATPRNKCHLYPPDWMFMKGGAITPQIASGHPTPWIAYQMLCYNAYKGFQAGWHIFRFLTFSSI